MVASTSASHPHARGFRFGRLPRATIRSDPKRPEGHGGAGPRGGPLAASALLRLRLLPARLPGAAWGVAWGLARGSLVGGRLGGGSGGRGGIHVRIQKRCLPVCCYVAGLFWGLSGPFLSKMCDVFLFIPHIELAARR